ncbi:MAG TPA: Hsp70 family protein [Kofleriaceae bacterium]|nr:Hsp70 family protein [Kofleriaceae bacterium]
MNDPIVGIDLGTSNTVVAHADAAGNVKVLADDSGYKVHPSVVSFHPNGGVVVGAAAKQRKVIDPQNTIYSVKRLIGRSFRSPEVQTARGRSPFQIKEGANQAPTIVTRGGEFAVPEISAIVLDHVRNVAAARLECPINRAVVTVPASFNDAQRSATATAGAIAGLTVVRVLNEPTAAALAYGHTRNLREIIAVYDFGGGTFDITLLKLDDQVYEVLGTSGDTFLGGDDLDERLVDKMVAKFLAENRIDLRTNEVSMMRLRAVAEQTKIELSRRSRAVVRVDEIAYGPRGAPLNLMIEISRDEFVREVADIVDRTFPVCAEALALANLTVDRVSDVILVGGTSKIPYVRDQVSKFFGKAPRTDVNPEDAVAAGAALQATSLERILSRKPSTKIPVIKSAGDETTAGPTELLELVDQDSGATMAPSALTLAARERAKRPTAGYDGARRASEITPKPDTSYSVTRPGVRDVADPERYPGGRAASPVTSTSTTAQTVAAPPPVTSTSPTGELIPPPPPVFSTSETPIFETRTPTGFDSRTPAQPLGRMTRPDAPPPPPNKTMFGVPAGAGTFDVNLDSGVFPGDERPPPRPAVPAPAPPPVPRSTARQGPLARPPGPQMTAQLPTLSRPPEPKQPLPPTLPPRPPLDTSELPEWNTDSEIRTSESWAPKLPSSTLPLAPAAPIAAPTAPTMIAPVPEPPLTARGFNAPTIVAEPSPASTAKGFQPPQSYPVQQISQPIPQGYPIQQVSQPIPPVSQPIRTVSQPIPQPLARPAPQPMPPLQPPAPRPAPILLEVTPRGLGIATVAGFCEELIRRNARVPAEMKKLFTTSRDQQDQVRIVVCQGESRRLDNNTVIGDLVLQGLPRRPRGETSIEVTFALDAAGVLHVRARDAHTGVEQRADLDLVGGIAKEDVAISRDRLQQLRR